MATTRHKVYGFGLGDCEDPELYAAQPLWEWQQTEHGAWCVANLDDPTFHIGPDYQGFGYRVTVDAGFTEDQWTEYMFRFSDKFDNIVKRS